MTEKTLKSFFQKIIKKVSVTNENYYFSICRVIRQNRIFAKNHKNSISYFSKMDKNKCPFLKNGLYSFLDFCVFIIINYFNINNCIDNYIYGR